MIVSIAAAIALLILLYWVRAHRIAEATTAGRDVQWNVLAEAYGGRRHAIYTLVLDGDLPAPDAARVFSAMKTAEARVSRASPGDPSSIRTAMRAEQDLWDALESGSREATSSVWRATRRAHDDVMEAQRQWEFNDAVEYKSAHGIAIAS